MKLHIQLSPELDEERTKRLFRLDLTPDPIAYGFDHAAKFGYQISYSRCRVKSHVYHFVRRAFIRALCFDIFHAIDNWRRISSADVIWTMTDVEYLGVLLVLKLMRNKTTFVVCNTVWLWDRLERRPKVFGAVVRKLLGRADVLTFHSNTHKEKASKSCDEANLYTLPFGISDTAFKIQKPRLRDNCSPIKIFSPGNDRTRDWETFYKAFANNSKFEVVVVCDRSPDRYFRDAANFVRVKKPSISQFNELYVEADIVVICMQPNSYSGITVALEAAALGTAVIVSNTGGVGTYFNREEVTFITPGDAEELTNAAQGLDAQRRFVQAVKAQHRFVSDSYVCSRMIADYHRLSSDNKAHLANLVGKLNS